VCRFTLAPQVGSCYFSRFFRDRGELLVTHQSFSREGRTYVAPFKAVEADEEGTLRARSHCRYELMHIHFIPDSLK
jgi:hypothetical protein